MRSRQQREKATRRKKRKGNNAKKSNVECEVKSKKANGVNENTLEWHMENFHQDCHKCHQEVVVHSFQEETKKNKKIVRCHCETPDCTERMQVVIYRQADQNMTCRVCKKEITFLGSRERTTEQIEAIYGICTNEECRERRIKVCFLGASLVIAKETKPVGEKKQTLYIREELRKIVLEGNRVAV